MSHLLTFTWASMPQFLIIDVLKRGLVDITEQK